MKLYPIHLTGGNQTHNFNSDVNWLHKEHKEERVVATAMTLRYKYIHQDVIGTSDASAKQRNAMPMDSSFSFSFPSMTAAVSALLIISSFFLSNLQQGNNTNGNVTVVSALLDIINIKIYSFWILSD